jgi:hypothetical protein
MFVATQIHRRRIGHDFAADGRRTAVIAGHAAADAEEPRSNLRAPFEVRKSEMHRQKDFLREVHHVGFAHAEPPQRTPHEFEVSVVYGSEVGLG